MYKNLNISDKLKYRPTRTPSHFKGLTENKHLKQSDASNKVYFKNYATTLLNPVKTYKHTRYWARLYLFYKTNLLNFEFSKLFDYHNIEPFDLKINPAVDYSTLNDVIPD